jgi:hypothetical protein
MHRFIKASRQHGLDRRYGAVLVTYADDFVILCRHSAAEVLETTRRWTTHIGLTLNEDKTRLLDARCDAFDFLLYTFGPMYSPRTGGRYNGVRPSKKPSRPLETPSVSGCGRETRHCGRTSYVP